MGAVHVHDVEAGRPSASLRPARRSPAPTSISPRLMALGIAHGVGIRRQLARRARDFAAQGAVDVRPWMEELDACERAFRVRLLAEERQVVEILIVPEPGECLRRTIGFRVHRADLGPDRRPASFGLHGAETGLGARDSVPKPVQCGTWKKRFLSTRGPSASGSKRMSCFGLRAISAPYS